LLIGLPLLSAAGFMHMTRTVEAASAHLPAPDPKLLAHRVALDEWRSDLLLIYASLVISAVGAGLLRNRLERRSLVKPSIDT
jgi:adenylate cyclase